MEYSHLLIRRHGRVLDDESDEGRLVHVLVRILEQRADEVAYIFSPTHERIGETSRGVAAAVNLHLQPGSEAEHVDPHHDIAQHKVLSVKRLQISVGVLKVGEECAVFRPQFGRALEIGVELCLVVASFRDQISTLHSLERAQVILVGIRDGADAAGIFDLHRSVLISGRIDDIHAGFVEVDRDR